MYVIIFFGLLMIVISLVAVIDPERFSRSIVDFCRWRFFHSVEVISRILIGVLFIAYANQTLYPGVMKIVGYVIFAVGIMLSLTPPKYHIQYGIWAAEKFKNIFRSTGVLSLFFGIFLIYAAIAGPVPV